MNILGQLIAENDPELAEELLQKYESVLPKAAVTDHSLLEQYYQRYCKDSKVEAAELKGNIYKGEKLGHRRVFICAMLHLYEPRVFVLNHDSVLLTYGFLEKLSITLAMDRGYLSRVVRQVIIMHEVYDDFRSQVKKYTKKLSR